MPSSRSACAFASTSRRSIFSAPATASAATCSRSCSRAREASCWMSALAAAFSRSPSALAVARASSITCAARFSACAMISVARSRPCLTDSSAWRVESSSDLRPCSAAASPSAMVFCRCSIARRRCGHTIFTVNQMKARNTAASANKVKLRLMAYTLDGLPCRLNSAERRGERVGEREEHRDAQADDEGGVDQAEQQEYLALQRVGELGLARGGLQEAAAHDAHADAGAGGAQADHQPDADAGVGLHHRQQLELFHLVFLS